MVVCSLLHIFTGPYLLLIVNLHSGYKPQLQISIISINVASDLDRHLLVGLKTYLQLALFLYKIYFQNKTLLEFKAINF